MKRTLVASALFASASSTALAGGLDRTGQPIDILFEDGNYLELTFARTLPNISGTGTGQAINPLLNGFLEPNFRYEGVGLDFNNVTAGVKFDITEQFSAAILYEQPFGSDIEYNGSSDSTELGGTRAIADSDMVTAMLRYKFDENWSAHGGIRIARSGGEIDLGGLAYGGPSVLPAALQGVNGYSVRLEDRTDVGWLLGVAYEIPDIALRVALTYNSAITHEFDTKESLRGFDLGDSTTEVKLPQSVNLDFQTGIAEDTLLFGSIRWAEWSEFLIDPEQFEGLTGGGLVDLNDSTTWTLGVGRAFTDDFRAQTSFSWEETDSDDLVSPLAPTNGLFAWSIGGAYDVSEDVTLSAGIRYTWLGNARPETGTPDTARAEFRDNSALTVGVGVGYRF